MAGLLGLVKEYVRINWKNFPDITTPLGQLNLNKMDYMIDRVEDIVVNFDTTKANQSDLLQTIRTVTYNETTGLFTFTFWNDSVYTVDLNIEKIPVSFSMSPQGVITMTTSDGTQYTADVGALIKLYTFVDSSEIDFTVTTDSSGNKTITASIVAGSITGDKLQPNYLADCLSAKSGAESAKDSADEDALKAEGFAVGEQNGVPVSSTSPYYHNNAKWYSEQANVSDKLIMEGEATLDPDMYYVTTSLIPSGTVFPNDPAFTAYTDTKYEVITNIQWNAGSRQLSVNFYNPLDTALTVKYKVYYKTV